MVPCGKVLQNKHTTATFTQGQGQMVKVKGKKSNCHFSWKLLKLQTSNLARWYIVARCFRINTLQWPSSKVKVKLSRSKVKKVTLPFFSETIKATDIKFGTMVPCGKVLENKHNTVTFTQGQGQMVKVKGQKATLPCGSKTTKVTVTTFGTMVLCDKVLQNIRCVVTFVQGQGHIKATITELGTRKYYVICPSC